MGLMVWVVMKMSDNSKNRWGKEVDDLIERVGEMILAIVGTVYSMRMGAIELFSPLETILLISICFGLYQGTTVLKYVPKILEVWKRW